MFNVFFSIFFSVHFLPIGFFILALEFVFIAMKNYSLGEICSLLW
jgi:hypothetical protein